MFRALALTVLIALFVAADAGAAPVRIVRGTSIAAPTIAQQSFMRDRYARMGATSPLGWFGATWTRQHAFALEPADVAAHPEWQLRDSNGNPVYIGSRVAGDFGNASFRSWWIARAQAAVPGHRGLWIDDVFMERRTTTAAGVSRTPIDPRTGLTMTEANWQLYLADFMVAVRAALPGVEIVHDVLWYKGDAGNVLRELQAADFVSLDKGFNDSTVTYGTSTYGFERLAGWVERQQSRLGIIFDAPSSTPGARMYGLAVYSLLNILFTAVQNDGSTAPDAFWPGYNVDLGASVTGRYLFSNVWRRNYAGGFVLLNEPYRTTRTITLPVGFQDLDGVPATTVTLAGGSGAIFVPVPPAAPTPTPEAPAEAPPTGVAPPTPVAPPKAPSMPTSSSSGRAKISSVGKAGARAPSATRTSVSGSRSRLRGRVRGAIAGTVRLVIERKRGNGWSVVRRESVTVKRSGSFIKDIRALPSGTYRVRGSFQGTGTSEPSRSAYSGFHA